MSESFKNKGLIIILSAPSGTGKTTLAKALIAEDENITLSISATTRAPRSQEVEGVHYYFKTDAQFDELVKNKSLLEYAKVHNHYYGTPKEPIENSLESGKDILFDIDWQGARDIKKSKPNDTVSIFILPPNFETLAERIKSRGPTSIEEINVRMQTARLEIQQIHNYDYVVINDDFDQALKSLQAIIKAERLRVSRLNLLDKFLDNGNFTK